MSRRLSDSGDDSSTSDKSVEQPPSFNCDGNHEENFKWKLKALNDELNKQIEELNSDFDKKLPALTGQIKKLQNITDELESMHKKITVANLTGASLGAAGGIASIAGLCLAPFTFGASLALVGVGAAVGISGGATGATSAITKITKLKNLCETIEKIITDVQNTIKSMIEKLSKIHDNIGEIEKLEETMVKEGVTTVRGAIDISEIKNEIDKVSALAVKDMLVFVQSVSVASAVVDDADGASTSQSADNGNKENIKSDTLKFIHEVRQKAAVFQKTLDDIERIKKTINQEFNKMVQSSTSSQAKPRGTVIHNDNMLMNSL
ncbi:hypothetical protein QQF64_036259 [Cirrhinus molitorella]|uniref:Apolipo L3-like protein n=1 Tax=Cirrhinus molitorella TaxID=172907 RepID=A0ABR3NIV9_9TELE